MTFSRRLATLLLLLVAAVRLAAADAEKFHAVSAQEPVTAAYLVTINDVRGAEADSVVAAVARAYSVRIEPFAAEGFRGFLTVTTPSRARTIGTEARVARVDEQRGPDVADLPPVYRVAASALARLNTVGWMPIRVFILGRGSSPPQMQYHKHWPTWLLQSVAPWCRRKLRAF
ncbi:MAG: hypothetical protein M3Q69_15990 [Acidobacteriota bacterium]|nr:hypothetical protein [Acidobacteriota bacterium]